MTTTTPQKKKLGQNFLNELLELGSQDLLSEISFDWSSVDLSFRPTTAQEREEAIVEMLNRLDLELEPSGPHRLKTWERGWGENLTKLQKDGISKENLQPGYCHYSQYRLFGELVQSESPTFETDMNSVMRRLIFLKFLKPYKRIIELGSGTGVSLMTLSELFKDKEIWGSDWTKASVEICQLLAKDSGQNFSAFQFDMFKPALSNQVKIDKETAILTCHSMEQLGEEFGPLLEFIQLHKPGICVHLEPIFEFYNPNVVIDNLAMRYHKKRNYLYGYLTQIQELEKQGKAEIIFAKRLQFGTLFHEASSLVVWKPL